MLWNIWHQNYDGNVYIGEAEDQKQDACMENRLEESAIAEHTWKEQHLVNWNGIAIVDSQENSWISSPRAFKSKT